MRKKIKCKIPSLNTDIFLTDFEEASKLLLKYKQKLEGEGWSDIRLEMEHDYDYSELVVYGERLENDDEYNRRLKAIELREKALKKRKEKELKELERLKKKYENTQNT